MKHKLEHLAGLIEDARYRLSLTAETRALRPRLDPVRKAVVDAMDHYSATDRSDPVQALEWLEPELPGLVDLETAAAEVRVSLAELTGAFNRVVAELRVRGRG